MAVDEGLLARAQAGDRDAVEELLTQLAPKLRRFGHHLCNAYSEDALQESLLTIAQHISGFRGESDLSSWSYAVVRSACGRLTRHGVNKNSAPLEAADELAGDVKDPEYQAIETERWRLLNCAMHALPPSLREAVLLRDVEGLSAEEAAQALSLSVSALKSRLHRGRGALARELDRQLKKGPPSGSCPDVMSALSRQQEGQLPERECEELTAHLAGCERCQSECDDLKAALLACQQGSVGIDTKRCVRAALERWQPRG